jgi:hypothetical protein
MRVAGALLLAIGVLLVGLRVVERLTGGFIGTIYVGGLTIVPFYMPLFAIGVVALALGTGILWARRRVETKLGGLP